MGLETILLVEDDDDIRLIARTALESIGGMRVVECERGTHAVDAALSCCPDLIVLDVMMPGMDGPETLAAIRAVPDLVEIPVIFMTAKVQQVECDRYIRLGAIGIVPKPFDPLTLGETLTGMWESARPAPKVP